MRIPFRRNSEEKASGEPAKQAAGKSGKKASGEPAKRSAGKSAKKKPAHKESSAPAKPPAPVGVTSQVGVNETWVRVFEKNEQAEHDERLTDEQISQSMKGEFPDLDAKIFDRVEITRSKYNRGGLHKKDKSGRMVRPKFHSEARDPLQGRAGSTRATHLKADGMSRKGPVFKHQKDFKSTKK